jgi:hypothetical protein
MTSSAKPKNISRYWASGLNISGKMVIARAPSTVPGMEPRPPSRTMQNRRDDSMNVKLSGDTDICLDA